jgi:hypothetical protein
MSISCLLAWNSVILITTIIFPSYQFPKGLHMNVKKQTKPTQEVYSPNQSLFLQVYGKEITVLCLVESVEQ